MWFKYYELFMKVYRLGLGQKLQHEINTLFFVIRRDSEQDYPVH